jgi:hypothetical protein
MASSCLGKSPAFEEAVAESAVAEGDHVVLAAAIKSGRVDAETGVQPEVV